MIYRKKIFILIVLVVLTVPLITIFKGCFIRKPQVINELYVTLYLHKQNKTIKLKFEEYIIGTVAAEMPASFELEALKAQAVCARTYAIKKMIDGIKYPLNSDLSDDINTCQAYISPVDFKQAHPYNSTKFLNKIKRAVRETRGEIMLYKDQPIDALYHSTCGGRTESAADVWQKDVPYLRSVECKYCTHSKYYSTVQVFSITDINSRIGDNIINKIDIRVLEKTHSGRIKKLIINNHCMSGEKFRKLFNLPSNWWKYNISNNNLIINSRGYGHGVGMCQYGANGMAKEGKEYKDILVKYYQNIDFYILKY